MKKIKMALLFAALCLACSFVSSCSDNEDEAVLNQSELTETNVESIRIYVSPRL